MNYILLENGRFLSVRFYKQGENERCRVEKRLGNS